MTREFSICVTVLVECHFVWLYPPILVSLLPGRRDVFGLLGIWPRVTLLAARGFRPTQTLRLPKPLCSWVPLRPPSSKGTGLGPQPQMAGQRHLSPSDSYLPSYCWAWAFPAALTPVSTARIRFHFTVSCEHATCPSISDPRALFSPF